MTNPTNILCEPIDIRSAVPSEMEALMHALNEPPYRAMQLFEWIHQRGANSFDTMTDLPQRLRDTLASRCRFTPFTIAGKTASEANEATKYLFALENTTIIESVLMRRKQGASLCVSTQAGCRMGCRFCMSAVGGLQRGLTAGEICAQVYEARHDADARVDGVLLMGCGEPLDNYEAVLRFITLISHPKGQHLGQRHIVLSTCGLVPAVFQLAEERLQITLAVSLHAPDDTTRRTLMPVAQRYSIRETLEACAYYAETTHRRVTFEYALIDDVNDSDSHARALARLLRDFALCHVNIIPMNETVSLYQQSRRTGAFAKILTERGLPVTVRRSMGGDIDAACGQLRRRYLDVLNQ